MKIVSSGILIVSGAYMALGLMYLRFWWDERSRLAYLAFSAACLSYAIFAWFEIAMMTAQTAEAYLFNAWWAFIVGSVGITSFAWFAYVHLHGRKWLFVLYAAMRGLALMLHLMMPSGINFRQITSVGSRSVLGELLSYPVPVPNPWMLLPHLSHAVLIVFFLDASVRCWRRGEHRMAWTFGTGTILFGAATLALPTMALWGLAPIPLFATCFVLFIVVPMLYELNYDMHRSAMLTEKLAEREDQLTETLEQLQLSALAGNVGMWTRSIDGEILWTSAKAAEIWGFPADAQFTQADLIQKVYAGDLERVMTCLQELASGKRNYQIDFRIVATDGTMRWVSSKGRADSVDGTDLVRGAIVDITKLKLAEEAIRDLTTRLMNAQEKERARLARELHDGLNQSVALLSIQIGMLRNDPRDITYAKQQLDSFAADIERLSEDVHRISYELHPANLNQLGLEAAISTLCRDLSASSDVEIDFQSDKLPRDLSQNMSLGLYRIAQESLRNVVRHSDATWAHVRVSLAPDEVAMMIVDNGKGFDQNNAARKNGLGLLSIRERVRRLDGSVEIMTDPGEGTQVQVSIPLREDILEYFPDRLPGSIQVEAPLQT